ncbi:ThiF family adenylyltransferase [Corallococcus sp. AB030]|uniref:ThiF family adenylyltransferase n=1 Tax=Corallococcus sp. AB030 TaxID=2316716 RepID=UPI000ECCCCCA|nr:ThiF family adenylyltransferase [Corallococcus sp. AB030]RKH97265.1 ThiF family adenylyltransferase [Corallococcus sp. AB030]
MSPRLFSHSPDLKQLRDEGYFMQIRGNCLVMREVPYVDSQRQVRTGSLISSLALAGDITCPPDTHVVHFDGSFPCQADGTPIQGISHQTGDFTLGDGVTAKHSFSSKPADGYSDYHQKMTTYANIISGPAKVLKPDVSPRVFREPEIEDNSIFNYMETASGRVGISALTERLASEKVAIVGLGGTGSYVLDFVAKTPVREIRLFDDDTFLQHNAFRAPSAASIEELRDAPKKVDYFKSVYSKMHRGIAAHAVRLDASNVHFLTGISFAFICMDSGGAKRTIIEKLETLGVAFVDVGLGLELVNGSLGGILRVTASTPQKRDHVHKGRISFSGGGADDLYSSNIQVADLNALNAVLAIIKWKKIRGFYRDLENEHHSTYTTDGNMLLNEDCK